jgi:hypothetical protein
METLSYRSNYAKTFVPTPGNVASVGATATQFRLKQSTPEMPNRYYAANVGNNAARLGSNTINGTATNRYANGPQAALSVSTVGDSRIRNRGFVVSDNYVNQGRQEEPILNQKPRYSWKLKVDEAQSDYGTLFQDLPGGYGPESNTLLRGTSYPRATVVFGIPAPQTPLAQQVYARQISQALPPLNAPNTGPARLGPPRIGTI